MCIFYRQHLLLPVEWDLIRRSRCWNVWSHVTRMFLQTKCVIWVKPKRSFGRGKMESGPSEGENVHRNCNGFSEGPSTRTENRSVFIHTKLLIYATLAFSEHLKFSKCHRRLISLVASHQMGDKRINTVGFLIIGLESR